MGEMTAESNRTRSEGWWIALALLVVVGVIGAAGTAWGFWMARRAQAVAEMSRAQAEEMRARASMEAERAEAAARAAEQETLRARQAEDAAETERQKTLAVQQFLRQTVTAADSPGDRGRKVDARAILDDAAKKLDAGEIKDPDAAASLHSSVGMTYMSLGEYEKAEKHLRAAVELRKQAKGEKSEAVAKDMQNLATVLKAQGK